MKKSVLVTAINTLILASLTACGGGGGGSSSQDNNAATTPTQTGTTGGTTTPTTNTTPVPSTSCNIVYADVNCTNSTATPSGFTVKDTNATTLKLTVTNGGSTSVINFDKDGYSTDNKTINYDPTTGNKTQVIRVVGPLTYKTDFVYDSSGNKESESLYLNNKLLEKIVFAYADNKLFTETETKYESDGVTVKTENVRTYFYNNENKVSRITNTIGNGLNIEKDYDCNGNLETESQLRVTGGTLATKTSFSYDKNINLISKADQTFAIDGSTSPISTTTNSYYCSNKINTEKTNAGTIKYYYDSENFITKVEKLDTNNNITSTKTFSYEGNPAIVDKLPANTFKQ